MGSGAKRKEEGQGLSKVRLLGGVGWWWFQGHSYHVQDDYLRNKNFPPEEQGQEMREKE